VKRDPEPSQPTRGEKRPGAVLPFNEHKEKKSRSMRSRPSEPVRTEQQLFSLNPKLFARVSAMSQYLYVADSSIPEAGKGLYLGPGPDQIKPITFPAGTVVTIYGGKIRYVGDEDSGLIPVADRVNLGYGSSSAGRFIEHDDEADALGLGLAHYANHLYSEQKALRNCKIDWVYSEKSKLLIGTNLILTTAITIYPPSSGDAIAIELFTDYGDSAAMSMHKIPKPVHKRQTAAGYNGELFFKSRKPIDQLEGIIKRPAEISLDPEICLDPPIRKDLVTAVSLFKPLLQNILTPPDTPSEPSSPGSAASFAS
jgi:hypothetical protein